MMQKIKADERIRTSGLRITNALLYQLSYVGKKEQISAVFFKMFKQAARQNTWRPP